MMTNVYFIRHAQPNYDNHDDMSRELSEKGLKDRALVTEFLQDKQIDAVLSSPFKRAVDTVGEFAEQQSFKVEIIEDFRERRIADCWVEDFRGFCKKQWEDFDYKMSDGECLREVQARNIEALKEALKKYAGKNVVVGSHGTALSTIINYYDNSFGHAQFEEIRGLMPWIVQFCFDGEECVQIRKYNVFTEKYMCESTKVE